MASGDSSGLKTRDLSFSSFLSILVAIGSVASSHSSVGFLAVFSGSARIFAMVFISFSTSGGEAASSVGGCCAWAG